MKFLPDTLKEILDDMDEKPNMVVMDIRTFVDIRTWGLCNIIIEDKPSRLKRGIMAYVNRDNPTFIKDRINDENRLTILVNRKVKPDCLYFYNTSLEDPDIGEKDANFILEFVPPLDIVSLPYQKVDEETYAQYIRAMVEQGRKDIENGDTISHEEMGRRLGIKNKD